LGIKLVGRVPERRVQLVQTANLGKLLVQEQPRDAYSQAIVALVDKLQADAAQADTTAANPISSDRPRSLPTLSNLLNRISHGKRN
jgi:Flp pilus assembly CpaE family ATPase